MQREIDWRHWLLGMVATVGLLGALAWAFLLRPPATPNIPAPAGATPRTQDAQEYLPNTPGLPPAR